MVRQSSAFSQNSRRSWAMFAVLWLCGWSVGLSQLKLTPVTSELMAMLGVSGNEVAWLTSVFTVAGVLLSIPGSGLIRRLGTKRMLIVMLAALVIGNALGAFAPSYQVMFASRLVEGIAAVFALPVAMTLVNTWFRGGPASIATGLFMAATPVATFAANSCGLAVSDLFGSIRSLWAIVAVLDAVCMVLAITFLWVPGTEADAGETAEAAAPAPAGRGTVPPVQAPGLIAQVCETATAPLALLCAGMFCLTFSLYSLITCYPQLFAFYGLPEGLSNLLTSLNGLVGIPMSVLAGVIIAKTGKPFAVAMAGAAGAFVTCATLPYLGEATYALNVCGSAIFPGGIAIPPLFILAPLMVTRAEHATMVTGLMNTFFYLGQLLSTPVTTALAQGNTTWTVPSIVLSAASLLFLVALVLAQRKLSRMDTMAGAA